MIINGIDLDGLAHEADTIVLPDPVKGRVVHIDADFLAYQVSYERADGDVKTFEDMKHNAEIAVATIKSLAGATAVHLHLTPFSSDKGKRFELALLKEYQGNRQDKPKPRYLHVIREWLVQRYPGTLHQKCEADDGMSSSQYKALSEGNRHLSIIASKDKDLNMVPGLHLDWDTGEIIDADEFGYVGLIVKGKTTKLHGVGQKFFWAQMLMGDSADNIQGLPKLTGDWLNRYKPTQPVLAAQEALSRHEAGTTPHDRALAVLASRKPAACGPALTDMLLADIKSNKEAFEFVKGLYRAYGEQIGFVNYRDNTPITWQQAFISEAQLLWMRKSPHDPMCVARWWKEINA